MSEVARSSRRGWRVVLPGLACLFLAACVDHSDVPSDNRVDLQAFPGPARARAAVLLERLNEHEDDPRVHAQLAELAHAYGRPELAVSLYTAAERLGSREFDVPYLRGLALRDLGRNEQAIVSLRQAGEINDQYSPLQFYLAELLVAESQPEEAAALLQGILRQRPDDSRARLAYGRLLLARGDTALAIENLRAATDVTPHYGAAHYALAGAYRQTGKDELAAVHLSLFDKYQRAGPVSEDIVLGRVEGLRVSARQSIATAARLAAAGDLQGAARVFDALLEQDPDNVVAHTNLVGIHGALGDYDQARFHYDTGRAIAPEESSLHVNFGVLMLKQNRPQEAVAAFEAAIAAEPDRPAAYKYLGISQQQLGQKTAAIASFRSAVRQDPLDHQSRYLLGSALLDAGDHDGAIRALEKALQPVNQKTPSYMRKLAEAYLAEGDMERAGNVLADARSAAQQYGQHGLAASIDRDIARLGKTSDAMP